MQEADYQTWLQKHKAQIAKIEADLESINVVTRMQPHAAGGNKEGARASSNTAQSRKKGSLVRRLAGRLCGRGDS